MSNRAVSKWRLMGAVGLAMALAGPARADPRDMTAGEMTTVPSSMSARPASLDLAPTGSMRPAARPVAYEMPDLRWDHVRGSARWTKAAMQALQAHGQRLVGTVPGDIAQWCPAYPEASKWERAAFWAGLLSTLSKHESTWRPGAVGGGGLWYGLVQILPATARGYGCEAKSGEALKDGELNMACAVRIMNRTVPRDGVVARGMKGVAADWGPFHSERKREDMRQWLVRQPYCVGLHRSSRPLARPDGRGSDGTVMAGEGQQVPLFVSWELDKAFFAGLPAASFEEGYGG